jgi:hypothetical protein
MRWRDSARLKLAGPEERRSNVAEGRHVATIARFFAAAVKRDATPVHGTDRPRPPDLNDGSIGPDSGGRIGSQPIEWTLTKQTNMGQVNRPLQSPGACGSDLKKTGGASTDRAFPGLTVGPSAEHDAVSSTY